MLQEITLNHTMYPIIATRKKGCRRYILKFNRKAREVRLTLPMRASLKDGLAFAHSKKTWLELQQEKLAAEIVLKPDMMISLLGERVWLKHEAGRGVATFVLSSRRRPGSTQPQIMDGISVDAGLRRHDDCNDDISTLTIHGDAAFFSRRLKDWLAKHLREVILKQAEAAAQEIDVKFSRIQIREVGTQWGSCSANGTLSFSFHLVFASPEQLHYIIAHEVAHLREMNHGARFWKLVEQLCPDYAKHRRWLKTHGHELQRIEV